MRMRQEILLGVGGMRALRALGIEAAVTHMNEGHSAFLALEKIRMLMQEQGLSFEQAREATRPTNIFTTHTPVTAGNERFAIDLMKKYFSKTAVEVPIGHITNAVHPRSSGGPTKGGAKGWSSSPATLACGAASFFWKTTT